MPENTVTHIITVPLDSNSPYQKVKMKQADSGRILQVNMTFNGQPLMFPAGTTGEFRAHKTDNTYIDKTSNVTIAGDVATVEIDSNTLAVAGDVVCDLIMSYNGKTLGIVNFIIDVMPGAIPKDAIESSDDWQALSEAATAAQAAAGRAENAASQSEDILTRIEDVEHHPVYVNPDTETLWNWDTATQSWVDSGISVAGSGDMRASVYDPAGGAKQVAFTDEVMDKATFILPGAGPHNSIYRGKYLGTDVTDEQYAAIQNGTFEDLYIGDYWTIGGVNYRIAAFDYYNNVGDTALLDHHAVIVPDKSLYNATMNATNITTGGYTGSVMRVTNLATAKTTIKTAFNGHVVNHRQLLTNAVNTSGQASGWAWFDSEVELMNEVMVYGSVAFGSSSVGASGYNVGSSHGVLPLFAIRHDLLNTRESYWLRDVASATTFAHVSGNGNAGNATYSASNSFGVRPAFSIS